MTDKTSKWEKCQTTAPAVIFIYTHVPESHNPNGIAGFGIRDEPFVMPPPGDRAWIATDEIEEVESTFGAVDEPDVSYTRTDIVEVRIAQLEDDLNDADETIERIKELLIDSINVLRGQPELLSLHSWHDLPARCKALLAERDALRARIEGARTQRVPTYRGQSGYHEIHVPSDFSGKRVALVIKDEK